MTTTSKAFCSKKSGTAKCSNQSQTQKGHRRPVPHFCRVRGAKHNTNREDKQDISNPYRFSVIFNSVKTVL